MQSNVKNKNGRIYPKNVIEREVSSTIKSLYLRTGVWELGHPDGLTVNLERVSHMIKDLSMEGDNVMGAKR